MNMGPTRAALAAVLWLAGAAAIAPASAQDQKLQLQNKVIECKIETVFRCTGDKGCTRQSPPAVLRIDFIDNNACLLGKDGACTGNRLFKPYWRRSGTVGLNFGERTMAYYITSEMKLVGAEARSDRTFGVFGSCAIKK